MDFKDNIEELSLMTSKLSLKEKSKKLYLDIGNMRNFFSNKYNHWDLETTEFSISKFIKAAKKSGWEVSCFNDFKKCSSENIESYIEKQEKYIKSETIVYPAVYYYLCRAIFSKYGIITYGNIEADLDDTLASHAHHENAAIFSQDKDFFFRFAGKKYELYNNFSYTGDGGIDFSYELKNAKYKKQKDSHPIITPPPKVKIYDFNLPEDLSFDDYQFYFNYGSPLNKELGNVFLNLQPLRKAVIYKLKGGERVEIIPFWDKNSKEVKWEKILVSGTPEFQSYLLDDPYECIEKLFNLKYLMTLEKNFEKNKWLAHLFSIYSLTFREFTKIQSHGEEKLFKMLIEARNKIFPNFKIQTYICATCNQWFSISPNEKKFFLEKNLHLPKNCRKCRDEKKTKKKEEKKISFNFRKK